MGIPQKISPLCLSGLKAFAEALTPTCYNNVKSKNNLKKEKTPEYGQLKLNAWHSTVERERGLITKTSNSQAQTGNTCNHSNPTTCITNLANSSLSQQQPQLHSSPPQTSVSTKTNFLKSKKQPARQTATVITAN